ncbi:MAG: Rrf2 family transcriptional regulator [Planctomycetes bacterium]|nr:Rrf2 family transcriptional regulator [Planctomycetota bacterium]
MLRISKKADYAVFLLGAIARQGAYPGGSAEDTVVSAHEIARQAGLNKSVVANLLKEFARHDVLDSVRGLRGGYRLAHPPAEISLGRILEVVEGKFVLVDCVGHDDGPNERPADGDQPSGLLPQAPSSGDSGSDCSLISFCPSKQPMRVVHERISQLFAEIHLDELCSMTPVCSTSAAPAKAVTTSRPDART